MNYIYKKVEVGAMIMIRKITKKIRLETHDQHMYKPIQNMVDDTVKELCDNVEEEVQLALRTKMMEPYVRVT